MKSLVKKAIPILLAIVLLGSSLAGCSSQSKEIKIGVYGGFTGPSAFWNTRMKQGIALAIKEINAAGGIDGKTVAAVYEDTRGNKSEVATAVQKLINQDKVVAVLGSANSGDMFVSGPIADKAGVLICGVTTTAAGIPQIGNYVFRYAGLASIGAPLVVDYAADTYQVKTVSVIYSLNNDWSKDQRAQAEKELQAKGITIVSDLTYSDGDTDFQAQATKIAKDNPDAVFLAGYSSESALIASQLRKLGYKGRFLAGEGIADDQYFKIAGQDAVGTTLWISWYPDESQSVVKQFTDKFKVEYGATPEFAAAHGYDVMYILKEAIQKAGTDRKAIRDAFAATSGHTGIAGQVSIDSATKEFVKPHAVVEIGATGDYVLRLVK